MKKIGLKYKLIIGIIGFFIILSVVITIYLRIVVAKQLF